MSRRNRRRRRARAVLLPVPLTGIIVLSATLALTYLWMDHSCSALGQQIKTLEQRASALRNEWVRERNKWAAMRTPANLEQALLRQGLVMRMAHPGQVVHVSETVSPQTPYVARSQWARVDTVRDP